MERLKTQSIVSPQWKSYAQGQTSFGHLSGATNVNSHSASSPSMITMIETTVPLPILLADDYIVIVDGLVSERLDPSIEALTHDFPQHFITRASQCAGNRRYSNAHTGQGNARDRLA
jgi:DMSO/TMAO reductase YedYZ molybdopterin-dependent catalytic subunit